MDETTIDEDAPPADETPVAQTLQEQAIIAAAKTLDYRDPEGNPIVDLPDDRASWDLGVQQGIDALTRLVPPEDPTAFAIGQLWHHQRAIAQQINVLTRAVAETRKSGLETREDVRRLIDVLDKYADSLPDPDSLVGRLGKWGGSRRAARAGIPAGYGPPQQIGPANG